MKSCVNHVLIRYNSHELLAFNTTTQNVYSSLARNRITIIPTTRQGCRGGKSRKIPVMITKSNYVHSQHKKVNSSNIVQIKTSSLLSSNPTNTNTIHFGFINAQSVNTKASKLHDHILDFDLDIQ